MGIATNLGGIADLIITGSPAIREVPCEMGEAVLQSVPAEIGQKSDQRRILVVDEELNSREGLRRWLVGDGHVVETASDGWQAIRKMKESRFDIAIIDLDLPAVRGVAVNGWDLARISRAYNPMIFLIMIGSESRTRVKAQLEALRVSEFIEKPINLSQLKTLVRQLDC
jgi:CheY-like chemotaxis protein